MPTPDPLILDLALPALNLEAGARVENPLARVWAWGPAETLIVPEGAHAPEAEVALLDAPAFVVRSRQAVQDRWHAVRATPARAAGSVPVVLLIHALTGDMRAGGEGGWWHPLVGPGRALDPTHQLIICVNNLGSCYGSSGPADEGFPRRADDRHPWQGIAGRGAFDPVASDTHGLLPATITTWDQARFLLAALDALGVERPALVAGGSVGGMIALALAMLAPARVGHLMPIAACIAADAWIQGFNHTARMLLLQGHGIAGGIDRALELARQVAHMSYRAPTGLRQRQGRTQPGDGAWSAGAPYAVQTYLEHQGARLRQRFHPGAYLAQLDAMDHHDIERPPPGASPQDWNLRRLHMPVTAVGIDSDVLYPASESVALAHALQGHGLPARAEILSSPHGHDAFLIEWDALAPIVADALAR